MPIEILRNAEKRSLWYVPLLLDITNCLLRLTRDRQDPWMMMETKVLKNGQNGAQGAFAAKSISKYEIICQEKYPLLKVESGDNLYSNIAKAAAGLDSASQDAVLRLYHPSLDLSSSNVVREEMIAVHRAKLEAKKVLEKDTSCTISSDILTRLILIYLFNAFEGGLIYKKASRYNHSCDPNCIYTIHDDTITIRAACDIVDGEELTISYLGILLWSDISVRRAKLQKDKYFTCNCTRCQGDDIASAIPCVMCHARERQYILSEDVQWEEVPVTYSCIDYNTSSCRCIKSSTSSEFNSILKDVMQKVHKNVIERISERHVQDSSNSASADEMDINLEIDEQLFQVRNGFTPYKYTFLNYSFPSKTSRCLFRCLARSIGRLILCYDL